MILNHTKVIIVGGSSGIGLGVAHAAVAAGAEVVLVGRSAERLLRGETGARGSSRREDDRRRHHPRRGRGAGARSRRPLRSPRRHGGEPHLRSIASFEAASARACVESKLIAAILLAKHACGRVKPGGSITFTSGQASDRPSPKGAVVAAVNGALGALARALAIEMAPTRVNVVSPGVVDTPIWTAIAGDGKGAIFEQMASRLRWVELAPLPIWRRPISS